MGLDLDNDGSNGKPRGNSLFHVSAKMRGTMIVAHRLAPIREIF